jgi:hypothetical protein
VDKKRSENRKLRELLDLMIVTGLLLIEAIECYRLIIQLSQQGTLSSYYNSEHQIFEHFRFKSVFIRNSKKSVYQLCSMSDS